MDKIKPIETIYNGYKFKSRLEARWAVFFDALEIKYEYEKEGYKLKHGWYLPDFWLPYKGNNEVLNFPEYPNAGEWLEIKGKEITSEEKNLMLDLSAKTFHSGTIMKGSPWDVMYKYHTHCSGGGYLYDWEKEKKVERDCEEEFGLSSAWFTPDFYTACLVSKFVKESDWRQYKLALNYSKQARFENRI